MNPIARSATTTALVLVTVCLLAMSAAGADPTAAPSQGLVLEGGDLRSEGTGPGLVGNPLLILGGVVLLGLATALVTVLLLRLTRRT